MNTEEHKEVLRSFRRELDALLARYPSVTGGGQLRWTSSDAGGVAEMGDHRLVWHDGFRWQFEKF